MNRKGAFELSIGTVVVIVIAMALLIMGLVLVRNIFTGSTGAVELINDNVKAQINQLFNDDDRKTVVYLPDNSASVEKRKSYNVRFGIKNLERGVGGDGQFTYQVRASEIESGCQLTLSQADSYIRLGASPSRPITISPGDLTERVIEFRAPESAPLCDLFYDIEVKLDGQPYDTNFFILKIEG